MNEITECFEAVNSQTGQPVKLAMQGLWLTGRITPAGARLVVVHTFRSAEANPIEVVYAFGLPRDAALRQFRIEGVGFRAHSELRPTEEARQEYERGIQQGSLSTLARTYRDGRVNLSVGNPRPGETVRVFLELVAGVELRDNGLRFRFPFTLAPCYHRQARAIESAPGVGELELPADQFGDLLLPPFMRETVKLHAVSFDLSVVGGGKILSVASPSHSVKVAGAGTGGARVGLGVSKDVPDRDLVLDVETEPGAVVVQGGGCGGGEARFNVTVPSTRFEKQADSPRTVVFILDRSGSMNGAPLDQARKAAAACLATLSDRDRFGLLAFDDSTDSFRRGLVPATPEHRRAGMKFLDAITARGGTELGQALEAGMKLARDAGGSGGAGQADLFVLTDGQVGATEAIVARCHNSGVRVHCLGIGAASQDRFLTLLARETGGVCRFLTPRERVDLGALDLFASVRKPLVADLQVNFSGLDAAAAVVSPPTAVFEGLPLVIMAQAGAAGPGALHLAWGGGTKTLRVDLSLASSPEAETVRLLQGARLITDLDARWDGELQVEREAELEALSVGQAPEPKRCREKLEKLSKEYGLASRAMSLVAVVERAGDDASKVPVTRVVPVGMPQDVAFGSYFDPAQGAAFYLGGVPRGRTGVARHRMVRRSEAERYKVGSCHELQCLSLEPEPRAYHKGLHEEPTEAGTTFLSRAMKRLFGPSPEAGPKTAAAQDLEDILLRKFGESQDGGLAGPDEAVRLARTLAALLILGLLGHSGHAGPFRTVVSKLVAFARPRLASIADAEAQRVMTRLVEAVEQGQIPDGPQNREFAEAVAAWLETTKADWSETARQWCRYAPGLLRA